MNKREYEKSSDYQESLAILQGFTKDVLEGDIEKLREFNFSNLTQYVGESIDPDMYLITQAIYILLWGDIYDLTFKKIGPWSWRNKYPFRGDTINSFRSLFGSEDIRRDETFAFRAKLYGADKNPRLWEKINKFSRSYHCIGNFIVIPNRGSLKYGINGARAGYYDSMRDYFDWFLIAVAEFQRKVKEGESHFTKFEKQLRRNPEYYPDFLSIKEWEERFFLTPYFKDGKPTLLFKKPLEERLKVTDPNGTDPQISYYAEEYLELLEDFIDRSEEVIKYRTDKIIEVLKYKLPRNIVAE